MSFAAGLILILIEQACLKVAKKRRQKDCDDIEKSPASPTKRARLLNGGFDDVNCDYIIDIGEVWNGRYRVTKILGRGSLRNDCALIDLQARLDKSSRRQIW